MKAKVLFTLIVCVLAGFLTSCKDDDEFDIHMLDGKWEKVYDAGAVAEGSVEYEFQAKEYVNGTFTGTMFVHDVSAGDSTVPFRWLYGSSSIKQKELYIEYKNGKGQTEHHAYFVEELTKSVCRLVSTETDEKGNPVNVINLRKIK
ncbi:hypothetical protein C7120_01035 [Prevotella sp. oral taxon 376]|uniref:hypothetical protein n=1 Tax=Prevotella sp. oral taxon 376 TaxID=712466 RepID=UPI000D1DB904|nr:hypothetical protein [Prevotella sp. oral taxon 376]PTL33246.1 hypothetical protein C7120_01035 [Prevotella sp. oral taxon 376]